jgi:hypothetical protein
MKKYISFTQTVINERETQFQLITDPSISIRVQTIDISIDISIEFIKSPEKCHNFYIKSIDCLKSFEKL